MKNFLSKIILFLRRNILGVLLTLSVLIQGVLTAFPFSLILLVVSSYFWEERIFPYALGWGLFLDFLLGGHLGIQAMVFLGVSFLTLAVKRKILGKEKEKLKLPYD